MAESTPFPNDAYYKRFFSEPEMVISLLQDFVHEDFVHELDYATLEPMPTEFIGEAMQRRMSDIIWRVRTKSGEPCYVVLLLEFQSKPDRFMALRVLGYVADLLRKLASTQEVREHGLPPVFPFVLYNGDDAWTAPQEVANLFAPMPLSLRPYVPQMSYRMLDERRIPAAILQNAGIAAQLVRLEQEQDIGGAGGARAIVEEILTRFSDERYAGVQQVFADWVGESVIKKYGESYVAGATSLRGVNNMLAENMDRYLARIKEASSAEGRAEGRAEERLSTVQTMLRMGRFALEDIAEVTRTNLDDVQKLQVQMQGA